MIQTIFITGKGGVGKSVVTAALAAALASLKYKTAVIEWNQIRMTDLFLSAPLGYEGVCLNPHLTLFNFDPASCFEEYASRHIPKQILFFLKNRWVHHFIDAVPGLNEILFLGKIYGMTEENRFDFLLIDAPATGHTLALCDAPQTAIKAVKTGALKQTLESILVMLRHPRQTQFLLVTQLEDFIIQETVELYEGITKQLGMSVGGVVVNSAERCLPLLGHQDPAKLGREAKPLFEILKFKASQIKKQQKLLEELQKAIPLRFATLNQQEEIEESKCVDKLAEELKPWVLQNLLKKKS